MITFKSFYHQVEVFFEAEYLVHRAPPDRGTGAWTLRTPPKTYGQRAGMIDDYDHIVLQDAQPWVDPGAVERGDKVVAFIKGEKIKTAPKGEGKSIMFKRGDTEHPFRYEDGSVYKGSKYAVFDGNSFKAYEE